MKYYSLWVVHILLAVILIFGTVKFMQLDPNNEQRQIDVTVVNTIQENNEDSTSYYGVFKLPNGKMISRKINRVTYASVAAGDEGTLNLSRYDTGEADRDPARTTVELLMILGTFLYALFGSLKLLSYKEKFNKNKYDYY